MGTTMHKLCPKTTCIQTQRRCNVWLHWQEAVSECVCVFETRHWSEPYLSANRKRLWDGSGNNENGIQVFRTVGDYKYKGFGERDAAKSNIPLNLLTAEAEVTEVRRVRTCAEIDVSCNLPQKIFAFLSHATEYLTKTNGVCMPKAFARLA